MNKKTSTKPIGATSYKETTLGVIPRSKLLRLELEGTKKGLELIQSLLSTVKKLKLLLISFLKFMRSLLVGFSQTGQVDTEQ